MPRDTVVTHVGEDEMILSVREAPPAEDVLCRQPVRDPVVFPVIETWLTGHANGWLGDPQPTPQQRVWHRFAPGCWHDLFSATDQELAGMATATTGNICRGVAGKAISTQADARLELRLSREATPQALPWPGMPSLEPLPLDLAQMPFHFGMFLHTEDKQFKYRIDRLAFTRRCEAEWVPYLKMLLRARL